MSITLHTTLGEIKIELYCELVPKTCKNFLALCAKGYYINTTFHRNIKDFIIQGGDPTNTGKGGESIYDKHFNDEFVAELSHDKRGVVSMANSGPNTNGSQFFITYSKQIPFDGTYTIFGRVIDGYETLDIMEDEPVGKYYRPISPIIINDIIIHANPIAEKESNTNTQSELISS